MVIKKKLNDSNPWSTGLFCSSAKELISEAIEAPAPRHILLEKSELDVKKNKSSRPVSKDNRKDKDLLALKSKWHKAKYSYGKENNLPRLHPQNFQSNFGNQLQNAGTSYNPQLQAPHQPQFQAPPQPQFQAPSQMQNFFPQNHQYGNSQQQFGPPVANSFNPPPGGQNFSGYRQNSHRGHSGFRGNRGANRGGQKFREGRGARS